MMSAVVDLRLLLTVDQSAAARVNRLAYAIMLLQAGATPRKVSGDLERRFGVSHATAWRTASMAVDLAEVKA